MPVRRAARQPEELEVYALAAAPLPQRIRVGRVSVKVLFVGPIAVLAGPLRPLPLSTEDALREQHAIVTALADRVDPLLPARFGSRITPATLDASLRPSIDVLVAALDRVRGRRQMTVRLIGPPAPPARRGPARTGTAYLKERRAAHSVPAEAEPFCAAVHRFVVDRRVQPGRGGIRTTLFHLIPREHVEEYVAAAGAAAESIAPWRAVVSGPWPPFAFAPELVR